MVANFLAGGATVSALARQVDAKVKIDDAGVANPIPGDTSELVDFKMANGTRNFTVGPAMSAEHVVEMINRDAGFATELAKDGADLVAVGEMGIGNTTAASAITAVMLDVTPEAVTGHGTGIGEAARLKKARVVATAIEVNRPDSADPLGVLGKVGGYEIALLAGLILKAAGEKFWSF